MYRTVTNKLKLMVSSLGNGFSDVYSMFRRNPAVSDVVKVIYKLSRKIIEKKGGITVKIMDFCGTHEWTITSYGLRYLMPSNVELIAGPGCPVCITPAYYVDAAIKLAMNNIRIFTYGDSYKLPGLARVGIRTLAEAKARNADVEVVYSMMDAIRIAEEDKKESTFLAIGFETTAPSVIAPVVQGKIPSNFTIINVHRLTPPVARYILENVPEVSLNGIIAPGHVSTITGANAWKFIPEEFNIPTVIAGFEPLDVLLAILEILRQIVEGKPKLVNEYSRVVSWSGNVKAQKLLSECCEEVDAAWRGIGFVPKSGLIFKDKYSKVDALKQYGISELTPDEWKYDLPSGCRCADVTIGKSKPTDCQMFMRNCTPANPYGPCMVSMEGACAIWAKFGGSSLAIEVAREIGLNI